MDGAAWRTAVHGVAKSKTRLSDFTFTFHFHALEKEMATHSSVLAWRIPGTGEPGELSSMGSHRVGHDWSNLAAAAAYFMKLNMTKMIFKSNLWGAHKGAYFYKRYIPTSLRTKNCGDFSFCFKKWENDRIFWTFVSCNLKITVNFDNLYPVKKCLKIFYWEQRCKW